MDFEINAGNVHDSKEFPKLYKRLAKKYDGIENIVADGAYKTPAIAKEVIDDNKKLVTPYKRPMTKKGFFKKYEYVYDEYNDCYICPNNEILKYTTTNRDGYKEYKSDNKKCCNCPHLSKCTESKNKVKLVTRHVWEEYIEICEDIRHTTGMKELYKKRKETIERVFADCKEIHTMRYTRFKGIRKNRNFLYLLFACMNLKKYANRIWDIPKKSEIFMVFNYFYLIYQKYKKRFSILVI